MKSKEINKKKVLERKIRNFRKENYSIILVITPAPTVLPPSLIANLNPSSNATGYINSTSISTLSPGITISLPSGNPTTFPVTSAVLK